MADQNLLISVGQAALEFQNAQDAKNADKRALRALRLKYLDETGEYFDEDEYSEDDPEGPKIIAAMAKFKESKRVAIAERARMKRAISNYRKAMQPVVDAEAMGKEAGK